MQGRQWRQGDPGSIATRVPGVRVLDEDEDEDGELERREGWREWIVPEASWPIVMPVGGMGLLPMPP